MADEPNPTPEGGDGKEPEKTLTQEQVNKIVEERLARERQKYADYDDLKTKAAEYDKLEESKKSEEQKLLERIEAAEKRAEQAEKSVAEAQVDALRARVAASRGLTDAQAKRLQGSTLEELEADATEVFGEPKKDEPEEPKGPFARPVEKLQLGASNDGDDTPDYEKIADRIASKNAI